MNRWIQSIHPGWMQSLHPKYIPISYKEKYQFSFRKSGWCSRLGLESSPDQEFPAGISENSMVILSTRSGWFSAVWDEISSLKYIIPVQTTAEFYSTRNAFKVFFYVWARQNIYYLHVIYVRNFWKCLMPPFKRLQNRSDIVSMPRNENHFLLW